MPKAQRAEVFDIDIDKFYDVIVDYTSYPEFVEEVSGIDVISQNDGHAEVEYSLNVIKKCKYTLELRQQRPNMVSWCLKSGDIFKVNNGSWTLEDLGDGKTRVTYSLEIDFKGYAPRVVINKLLVRNIPELLNSYYRRALIQ